MESLLSRVWGSSDAEKGSYEVVGGSENGSPLAAQQKRQWRLFAGRRGFLGCGWTFWFTLATTLTVFTVVSVFTDTTITVKATVNSLKDKLGVTTTSAGPSFTPSAKGVVLDPNFYLNGVAGDTLRSDLKYVTTFHYAGLTNDFMMYCNLIYLGIISRRIPVIPPFEPSDQHIGKGGYSRDFGEIYDVPRLIADLGYPVLEWKEIKRARYNQERVMRLPPLDGVEKEELGCWNLGMTYHNEGQPYVPHADLLNLNLTFSGPPKWTALEQHPGNNWGSLTALAKLILPEARPDIENSPELAKVVVKPDDQLSCFNVIYHTAVRQAYEWEKEVAVVWDLVGVRVHYTRFIEDLSRQYIRRALGLEEVEESLPPFIAVHIRRTDFKDKCKGQDLEKCMAPLSAYERRVNQVQEDLIARYGAESPHAMASQRVIVASDESDPAWWETVRQKGWKFVDHEQEDTATKYGQWYVTLIDSSIQSMSMGFVGTAGSTFSLVSGYRVRDWNRGVARMVYFGKPGEDDKHQRREEFGLGYLTPELWE